jgi:predicted component of viral defense system (DUF524 family)
MIELVTLKTKIENLTKKQQVEILRIIMKIDVSISENNNGIFFNLSSLSKEQLSNINKYIDYVSDQEKTLQELEVIKSELSEAFFNSNNKSIKGTSTLLNSGYEYSS